jgi:MFS family permease
LNYRYYLLILLTVIGTFNYVDRLTLGVVLQDIKIDLGLTDSELGLLGGLSFALFYSVMGVPLGRWADRGNRRTVVSVTTALWSVGVALCGLAANFPQLLLIRVGVAVGEAGCFPPAFSLIGDYFKRHERSKALAIYGMSGAFSTLLGYSAAGWLNERFHWRMTFVLLGLIGLPLAILARLTMREPRLSSRPGTGRVGPDGNLGAEQNPPIPSLLDVAATMGSSRTFRHLLLCASLMFFFIYGMFAWWPSYFIRSFHLTTGFVGLWLGISSAIGSVAGSYIGGRFTSDRVPRDERAQLRMMSWWVCSSGVCSILSFITSTTWVAFALIGLANVGMTTINGPLFSTIQTLVPDRMRAVTFALVYLCANLIGMGFGPLTVGLLSDGIAPIFGSQSLHVALIAMSPGYAWCAWHAWQASKTATADIDAAMESERSWQAQLQMTRT